MEIKNLSIPKKYTIGKYLRHMKNLRKEDPLSQEITDPDAPINQYYKFLASKGLKSNKIAPALFKTKNDQYYLGIMAKEKIYENEILLKVPRNLILSTKIAYFSEIKLVFDENIDFFCDLSWEDKILLTFLLYENTKMEKSEWFHLIKNLPRDIDYLAFWPEKEMDLLEDEYLKKSALEKKTEFDDIYESLSFILKKYPQFFKDEKDYDYDNAKWIYTHIVTRCFGGDFHNVTMVPYAEYFNHECTNITYKLAYKPDNINKGENEVISDNISLKELNEEELDNMSTSQESNNSVDFEIEEFEKFNFNQNCNKILDENLIKDSQVCKEVTFILNWVMNSIDLGDAFSIFYFQQIIESMNTFKNEYNKKKNIKEFIKNCEELKVLNLKYKNKLYQYYSNVKNKDLETLVFAQSNAFQTDFQENETKNKKKFFNIAKKTWPEETFDYFILKTTKGDQFEKNSQLYLCYKRLSNIKLLNHYGIALEYNKYNHLYMRIDYLQFLNSKSEILHYISSYNLGKKKKFKITELEINMDLINFCKGLFWKIDKNKIEELFQAKNFDLEIQALKKMIIFFEERYQKSNFSEEDNDKFLRSKDINHHQYFSAIYRQEKRRILLTHIKLANILLEILKRIKNGQTLSESLKRVELLESEEEWKRNRIMAKSYLESIVYI